MSVKRTVSAAFFKSYFHVRAMPTSPTEDQVIHAVLRARAIKGTQIGAQIIHDYIKETHPDWILSPKRLRQIRRSHGLVPSEEAPVGETKKLDLILHVGKPHEWKIMEFKEDIPASYCIPKAVTHPHIVEYINKILNSHSNDVLTEWNDDCLQGCGRRAKFVYAIPKVQLLATPPTVFVLAQPLCSITRSSLCAQGAAFFIQQTLKTPGNPFSDPDDILVPGYPTR